MYNVQCSPLTIVQLTKCTIQFAVYHNCGEVFDIITYFLFSSIRHMMILLFRGKLHEADIYKTGKGVTLYYRQKICHIFQIAPRPLNVLSRFEFLVTRHTFQLLNEQAQAGSGYSKNDFIATMLQLQARENEVRKSEQPPVSGTMGMFTFSFTIVRYHQCVNFHFHFCSVPSVR